MDADDERIRRVEIAAARAWPATETAGLGGWLLRRTPAVDRARNNSALPPPLPDAAVDLAAIEDWYRRRGTRARVQVSPLAWHRDLDATLAAAGWTVAHGAEVLVGGAAATLSAGTGEGGRSVTLSAVPSAAWLAAWSACEERDRGSCAAHAEAIFAAVAPRATYAIERDADGREVAVGIAVRDPGIAGIFCMATHPARRLQGAAGRVLRALAADAANHGADTLYLQVDSRNAGASALYARHGFTRSHSYHFRVAP